MGPDPYARRLARLRRDSDQRSEVAGAARLPRRRTERSSCRAREAASRRAVPARGQSGVQRDARSAAPQGLDRVSEADAADAAATAPSETQVAAVHEETTQPSLRFRFDIDRDGNILG